MARRSFIKKKGAYINNSNKHGNTALHTAVFFNNEKVVELLLKNGAFVNDVDTERSTALHLASIKGFDEIAKLLLENGANVNAVTIHRETPIFLASKFKHFRVVSVLLNSPIIDINLKNKNGKTAFDVARSASIKKLLNPNADNYSGKFNKYENSYKHVELEFPDKEKFLRQNCKSETESWLTKETFEELINEGEDILVVKYNGVYHCYTYDEVNYLLEQNKDQNNIDLDKNPELKMIMRQFIIS
jgi:ankyrin repeat protein